MGCGISNNSLFGPSNAYIKHQGGDIVAIEGPNTTERLILGDIRYPYKQLLKGRVILKAGQVNYLMNHLGLGDNATYLFIVARYNPKAVIAEDNYVSYSYYDDMSRVYTFAQSLNLTGTSTKRVPQLYLSNPNATYSVTLDVMVGVVDENYSFFPDNVNNQGLTIYDLTYIQIQTHVVGQSFKVVDLAGTPIAFFMLNTINSVQKNGTILVIDDSSIGRVYLDFIDTFNMNQAYSIINWLLEDPTHNTNDLNPPEDVIPPLVEFTYFVDLPGSTYSKPYNTTMGDTFSATMSLTDYSGTITSEDILYHLVSSITDARDGIMAYTSSYILINGTQSTGVSASGTYSITFDVYDAATNMVSPDEVVELNIQN